MGTYNGKPLYKQDGGEHYLYYNRELSTWMVGPQVGKNYGWLRKQRSRRGGSTGSSSDSDSDDGDAADSRRSPSRLLPDDLSGGWQYQPLGGGDADEEVGGHRVSWLSDDQSLRVEPLRGKNLTLLRLCTKPDQTHGVCMRALLYCYLLRASFSTFAFLSPAAAAAAFKGRKKQVSFFLSYSILCWHFTHFHFLLLLPHFLYL